MTVRWNAVATMLGAMLGTMVVAGCGPLTMGADDATRAAYAPPSVRFDADEPTAFAAVQRYVASMGWTVDEADAAQERLVAHIDTRDAYTLQRDTWTFRVTPGFVAVRRRMQLGDTNGTSLVTSDDVCGTYTYASEFDHLSRIAALIESGEKAARVAQR